MLCNDVCLRGKNRNNIIDELKVTAVGPCFEELAEAEEFAVYERFTREVLSPVSSKYLTTLLSKPEVSIVLYPVNTLLLDLVNQRLV